MISFALVERQSQLCLFEFLYRTYSQGMFQIAYGILHDVQHAEDMVAETYIRVAKNINRIAEIPADKHRSYLKMIIRKRECRSCHIRSIHAAAISALKSLSSSMNTCAPERSALICMVVNCGTFSRALPPQIEISTMNIEPVFFSLVTEIWPLISPSQPMDKRISTSI